MLACAVPAALAIGGCTQDLAQDVVVVNLKYDSPFGIRVIPEEYYKQANYAQEAPSYHFKIDGSFATWDASTYVSLGPGGLTGLTLPAGSHTAELVDAAGQTIATSPPFDAKPARDLGSILFQSTVVFFGEQTNMNARVLVDDAATVPDGATHVRVMNLLADRQAILIMQCPTQTAGTTPGSPPYTASACAQVGAPLAYGDVFEMDASADVLGTLGYTWDASGALDPVVNAFPSGASYAPTRHFITVLPVQVGGPMSICQFCLGTVY